MRYVVLSDGAGGYEVRDMWEMRCMGIFSSFKTANGISRLLNESQQ
jgi:hypothetical protein